MSELLNHIVFKRLIFLRKELGYTQKEFVINFNKFIVDNNIKLLNKSNNPLKADNYSNIERRLTSQTETLVHFIKYYQQVHDINPSWIFTEDNSLVSKYLTLSKEARELNELKNKLAQIKTIVG